MLLSQWNKQNNKLNKKLKLKKQTCFRIVAKTPVTNLLGWYLAELEKVFGAPRGQTVWEGDSFCLFTFDFYHEVPKKTSMSRQLLL